MVTPNLEAVYNIMYPKCPDVCLANAIFYPPSRTGEIVKQNPPLEEDMAGWVTNPEDKYCNYCRKIIRIRDDES